MRERARRRMSEAGSPSRHEVARLVSPGRFPCAPCLGRWTSTAWAYTKAYEAFSAARGAWGSASQSSRWKVIVSACRHWAKQYTCLAGSTEGWHGLGASISGGTPGTECLEEEYSKSGISAEKIWSAWRLGGSESRAPSGETQWR